MAKKKKKPKKPKRKPEVFCHYANAWIPLGRAKKKCPHCGAVLTMHEVRK
jgi:ribosomal protein S27AE